MSDALVIEVVRKTVTVDCAVEEAFRVFTAEAARWWPVDTHSIHQSVSEIVFEPREGGEVYELTAEGERGHWATVLEWNPPSRLVLAWEVSPAVTGTEVEVRFTPSASQTRVELEHRGWERLAKGGAEKRGSYDTGWDAVLTPYVERLA